ncbi:MAG: peptidylprolyl isomerase, partial [Phyllobacteriaceae bacterium]|nr:peptidylprolyl isomerase [Phyllobacteriaceae bacterium]
FDENKSSYAFPEFRGLRYLKLEPEDLAAQVEITDSDLQADYDSRIARFTTPETRTIQQLLFADRAAADAARASIDAGQTFDDLIAAQGKTAADVTIGTFGRAAMTDAAIGDAAFAVPAANGVTPVAEGQFGPALLRITAITSAQVTPFADAKEQIRQELQLQRAADNVLDVHDAYEDARASGESMVDAAAKLGLKIVDIAAVSRAATTPDGTVLSDLPASNDLLRTVFDAEIDAETPPINLGASGFLWAEATSIQPARDAAFDEVKTRVAADWLAAETDRLLGARAEALLAEIKAGKTLAEIAANLALEVETAPSLSRGGENIGLGTGGVEAAFGGAQGESLIVPSTNGDAQILLTIDKIVRPDAVSGRVAAEKDRVSQVLTDDLLAQLINRLQLDTPVSVNQAAIERALAF